MQTHVFGLLLLGAMGAVAGAEPPAVIGIHIEESQRADMLSLRRAQMVASELFEQAGIRVMWKRRTARDAGIQAEFEASVRLSTSTPPGLRPEALAYALPYLASSGAITVFYDRIVKRRLRPERVLAHVIVHEVTHILQGIARHSETGVMKADWTREDYLLMERSLLPWAAKDIELIHLGLRRRADASCGKMPLTQGPCRQ